MEYRINATCLHDASMYATSAIHPISTRAMKATNKGPSAVQMESFSVHTMDKKCCPKAWFPRGPGQLTFITFIQLECKSQPQTPRFTQYHKSRFAPHQISPKNARFLEILRHTLNLRHKPNSTNFCESVTTPCFFRMLLRNRVKVGYEIRGEFAEDEGAGEQRARPRQIPLAAIIFFYSRTSL